MPPFADKLDVQLEVPDVGTLVVDTAFGGDNFVLVDATQLGLLLTPENARTFAKLGSKIIDAANGQIGFSHPILHDWTQFSFCQFTWPVDTIDGVKTGANTVVITPVKLDRSPCGTGASARMAVLHANGKLAIGEPYKATSIIGSAFNCRLLSETTVGDRAAVNPSIAGTAYITGMHQHMLDPSDTCPTR